MKKTAISRRGFIKAAGLAAGYTVLGAPKHRNHVKTVIFLGCTHPGRCEAPSAS